jgi:hypothetical protein
MKSSDNKIRQKILQGMFDKAIYLKIGHGLMYQEYENVIGKWGKEKKLMPFDDLPKCFTVDNMINIRYRILSRNERRNSK